MKRFVLLSSALAVFLSCKTKKVTDNLPKDIALKPVAEHEVNAETAHLQKLRAEIDSIIQKVPCTDAAEWRSTPIGDKPCGGPMAYLAYPIQKENEILPKIQEYTKQQSAINKKRNLMSDCSYVTPPSGIKCVNKKAVLIKGNGGLSAE